MTPRSAGTVVVTGASGMIGSSLCRRLAARGTPVVGIDDFSVGEWDGEGLPLERADVASARITDVLDRIAPAVVVHAAAHPGARSLTDPVEDVRINALGAMRVFDWCARHRAEVVYLSSSVIYGDGPAGPIPESAPLRPGTIYGACKVACEQMLPVLERGYGLRWTVLRLFATYGAGHKPGLQQGIVNVMLTQLAAGTRVVIKGSLERTRDLMYVEDGVTAIVSSIDAPAARGRVLNVGTGTGVTIRSLIAETARALGKDPVSLELIEEAGTPGDPWSSVADNSAAREVLGFTPRYALAAGLAEVVRLRMQPVR